MSYFPKESISRWQKSAVQFVVVLLCLSPLSSTKAAYCSLRDPITAIRTLYPEADRHYSIVRTVSHDTRNAIAERLPFTLHFNELGRHTMYVVQKDSLPLGFIHTRSELSEWGIVEIAWAITTDLRIQGFYFQRCRTPACNEQLIQSLIPRLKGKTLEEILVLLTPDGEELIADIKRENERDQELILSIIRSALKTLAATEYAWNADIKDLRRRKLAMQGIKANTLPELVPVSRDALETLRIPEEIAIAQEFIEASSIEVYQVVMANKELARVVDARWQWGKKSGEFSWLFASNGEVLHIEAHDPLPDEHTALAFNELLGQQLSSAQNCASAAELAGGLLYQSAYH